MSGLVVGDRPWVDRAACRRVPDPEALFYPPTHSGYNLTDYSAAVEICASCPVQGQCFAFAVEAKEIVKDRQGWRSVNGVVWAGIAPRKRPIGRPVQRAG